jgi:hypothetical protein
MSTNYIPLVTPPGERRDPALWFAFQRSQMLVCQGDDGPMVPCCNDLLEYGLNPVRTQYLGTYDGRHCYTVEVNDAAQTPAGWQLVGLRDIFAQVEETLAMLSGRAFQIIDWDRNHQFCSRCGAPTHQRENERARVCSGCRRTTYPPISPAVMILVTRGRELLLARKPSFAPGRTPRSPASSSRARCWKNRGARDAGGSRRGGEKHPLLRQPAVAVSAFVDGRVHRRARWRRHRRMASRSGAGSMPRRCRHCRRRSVFPAG